MRIAGSIRRVLETTRRLAVWLGDGLMVMQKNTKVVLVNPPSLCVDDDRLEPHLGLLYVASAAREKGYRDVTISDMSGCQTAEEVEDKISHIPPADTYGITSLCTTYPYVKQIIAKIKHDVPLAYVGIGGPNPSGLPEFTLMDSGVDVVFTGESDDTFVYCLDRYEAGDAVRGIVKGIPRDDIDTYPFPARDLVDMSTYTRKLANESVVSLISSRGCQHQCIFCNSVVMGGGNHKVRYRSTANVTKEIGSLRKSFSCYRFNDDNFTGNPKLEDLLVHLKDFDILFRVFARVEDLDNATCALLKDAGCVHVSVGLETLNPDNLRIIGKARQIKKEDNIRIAKSYGLVVRSYFMVGLPFDTDETVQRYFHEASRLEVDEFAIYPMMPYPGTELAKFPGRLGYTIADPDFTHYIQIGRNCSTCYPLRHKNFAPADVERWHTMATDILESGGMLHVKDSGVAV